MSLKNPVRNSSQAIQTSCPVIGSSLQQDNSDASRYHLALGDGLQGMRAERDGEGVRRDEARQGKGEKRGDGYRIARRRI